LQLRRMLSGQNCRLSLRGGDLIKWRLTQMPYNSKPCRRWQQTHQLFDQCSGSIFGTVISQARNDFGDADFIDHTLSGTLLTAYNGQKMAGTRGA